MLDENAVLARELSRVQERSTRLLAEKSSEIERLGIQLVQVRAGDIAKDNRIAFLQGDLAGLKSSIAGFESSARLQKKLEQMTQRQSELETQISVLRQKLAAATRMRDAQTEDFPVGSEADAGLGEHADRRVAPVTLRLGQKTVLCVGGRSGNIANYRELVERAGRQPGRGGSGDMPDRLHQSQRLLDGEGLLQAHRKTLCSGTALRCKMMVRPVHGGAQVCPRMCG